MNYRGLYFVFFNEMCVGFDAFDLEYVDNPFRRKRVNKFITEYVRSAGFKNIEDYLSHFPGHEGNETPEWSDVHTLNNILGRWVTYGSEKLKYPVKIQFEKYTDFDTLPKENVLYLLNDKLSREFSSDTDMSQMIKFPTIANARPFCVEYEDKNTKDGELWFCRDWKPELYTCNKTEV